MIFSSIFLNIKDLFKAISNGTSRFLDLAGKFDKDEIKDIQNNMADILRKEKHKKKKADFQRGKTKFLIEFDDTNKPLNQQGQSYD